MEEEEKKDMDFDSYKDEYLGHIEGTVKNEREAAESVDEEAIQEAKKSVAKSKTSKRSALNKSASQFDGEDDASRGMSQSKSRRSVGDKSELAKTTNSFKWELPESCFVTMVKRLLIDKLPGKYFVASHPFPKIEGELLIIRPKKED